ncbi:unnamed protein product [Ostreobium quekettii]|uniref:Agenet domain-containing protein n=1 Tax=Ostreobium quekettii TaxID=121088 RepID=A0A8S1IM08_9CHLO|nr:unnamed protein product [Ostreobium quekettii]|eukprot:evm.model.scf_11.15 EVM.evm.TU.scf_11.15   scf_11:158613-162392(+)
MAPLQFSFPLSHTPAYPDAVQWSQDDLLAVAAGAVVVILNPFNLGGPRACAAGAPPDVGPLVADCVPQRPQSCLKFSVAALEEMRLRDAAWRAPARSLAWSPRGCAPDGGCLLARVLADHQVLVDAAPVEKISANWVTMANLTKPLCEHVRKQDLEVSYCAHLTEMSLGGPGLLSTSPGKGERSCETQPDEMPLGTPGPLSGGPKQKEQVCKQQQPTTSGRGHGRPRTRPPSSTAPHAYCPAKGDSVEVANKGEGLGGSWFRAKVQDVRDDGFALVQYLDLSLDGKGKEPRREWFPFCRLEMSCPPTGIADDCEVHMDRRHHRMRPTPPDDVRICFDDAGLLSATQNGGEYSHLGKMCLAACWPHCPCWLDILGLEEQTMMVEDSLQRKGEQFVL